MSNAVPQINWIANAQGRAEFFNKQRTKCTGGPELSPDVAHVATTYFHPEDAGSTMAAFQDVQRTGGAFAVGHRIRSRDGRYRWSLVRAKPYRDPQSGKVVRWFGASIDINGHEWAEAALRDLNETLERRVARAQAERKLPADMFENTDAMIFVSDRDLQLSAFSCSYADEVERLGDQRPHSRPLRGSPRSSGAGRGELEPRRRRPGLLRHGGAWRPGPLQAVLPAALRAGPRP